MKRAGRWRRLRRNWEFARHISPAKLLRRLQITLGRALRDHGLVRVRRRPTPAFSAQLPSPLFPPRCGKMQGSDDALELTFLGRAHRMSGRIDWDAPGAGPALQLWRMNLHYMEYLEEADDTLFLSLVTGWIVSNPVSRPGAWRDSWNSYALSLRIVVWMQQLAERRDRLSVESLRPIVDSIAEQIHFLVGALETDIGGNHLVKNIKALIWASAFFTGPAAVRWRETGLALFGRALDAQVLACGLHAERSPSYHAQVFADFLECRHVLGAASPPRLDAALAGMAQVTADLAHPDGAVAQFNDAGLSMAYAPVVCLDVFERLFGRRPAPRATFVCQPGGYFGLRSGGHYFVADCGRIAPDDLPAHGHGDVLSFEWSVAGKRFIVDPGVYDYVAGDRRQASRSAALHNTLCFVDADQAEFFGAFRCGRRPNVEVRQLEKECFRLVLEGSHDGFRHLAGRPVHVRRFEVTPGSVAITDRIEGRPEQTAEIGFLLHPEVQVMRHADALRLMRDDAVVILTASAAIDVREAVWWPDMGTELRTKRLVIAVARGVNEVITMLRVETPLNQAIVEDM